MRLTFFSPRNVPKGRERGAVFAGYSVWDRAVKVGGAICSGDHSKKYMNKFLNSFCKKNLLNKENRINGSSLDMRREVFARSDQ